MTEKNPDFGHDHNLTGVQHMLFFFNWNLFLTEIHTLNVNACV